MHLSDLHLSGDVSKQDNTKARLGFLFDSLIKIQEDGKPVDIVVFTGNLIDKGGKDDFSQNLEEAISNMIRQSK